MKGRCAPEGRSSFPVTSSRPYVIRAIYDWIIDNGLTPHLLVDALCQGVDVPLAHVTDGQIVLNISPNAVVNLDLGNDFIVFNGRFGGVPTDILVPVRGVLGIYARENGQGMVFDSSEKPEDSPDPPPEPSRPSLKVVK